VFETEQTFRFFVCKLTERVTLRRTAAAVFPTPVPRPCSTRQNSLKNRLLTSLPDLGILVPHASTICLPQGIVLFEVGDEIDYVYFPHTGMLSLISVMRDGRAIETATIGREGVVGAMAGLGLNKSRVRVMARLGSTATRIAAPQFRNAVTRSGPLYDLCIRYNEVLLAQARITTACNALHALEARICRWLLESTRRIESNTVVLTQKLLADMLGVRRTSVTEIARRIQDRGIISYSRGMIKILDRTRLERLACECYHSLIEHEANLLNPKQNFGPFIQRVRDPL
jgi:CRP-like cAMP-binding protein